MTWREGCRIVDLCELARQLYCKNCSSLMDLNGTKGETIIGLASVLHVVCRCGVTNQVHTGKRQANIGMTEAYIINMKASIGIQLNRLTADWICKFLRELDIPAATWEILSPFQLKSEIQQLSKEYTHTETLILHEEANTPVKIEEETPFDNKQSPESCCPVEFNSVYSSCVQSCSWATESSTPQVNTPVRIEIKTSVEAPRGLWESEGDDTTDKKDSKLAEVLPEGNNQTFNHMETQILKKKELPAHPLHICGSEDTYRSASEADDDGNGVKEKDKESTEETSTMECSKFHLPGMQTSVREQAQNMESYAEANIPCLASNTQSLSTLYKGNHRLTHPRKAVIENCTINDLCATFKCRECGARFALAKALTMHMKVHSTTDVLHSHQNNGECSVLNDEDQQKELQEREEDRNKDCNADFQEKSDLKENFNFQFAEKSKSCQTELSSNSDDSERVTRRNNLRDGDWFMEDVQTLAQSGRYKFVRNEDQLETSVCEYCGTKISSEIQPPANEKESTGKRPLKCPKCGTGVIKKKDLKKYYSRTHKSKKTFSCQECGVTVTSSSSLKDHMKIHTGEKPFKCEICIKFFRERSNYRQHMRKHNEKGKHVCQECGKTFLFKSALNKHRNYHTGQRPYSCKECKAAFHTFNSLNVHMRIHTDERPFVCEICHKSFRQQSHLKGHKRTHSGERPYLCQECGRTFTCKYILRDHLIQVHSKEKPYECSVRNDAFNCFGSLTNQMATNTDKTFSCDICQRPFQVLAHLRRHKKMHIGGTCLCQICGKQFSGKLMLQTHQQVHTSPHLRSKNKDNMGKDIYRNDQTSKKQTEKKIFHCQECAAVFRSHSNLIRHVRIHSGIKPYSCEICLKAFNQSSNLKTHIKIHSSSLTVESPGQ